MKTILPIMFLLNFLLGEIAVSAEERELPLATGEWSPYTGKELEGGGFFTEIMTLIVKEMGMKPVYKFFPWPRAAMNTEKGLFFGAFPYALSEEREKKFNFSDPIHSGGLVFFYSKKHFKEQFIYKTLNDFKTYRIGTLRGSFPYETLSKAGFKKIDTVTSVKQLIKMLNAGRISFVMLNKDVGLSEVNALFPKEKEHFGFLDDIFPKTAARLMISRSYPNSDRLLEQFNHALKQVKKDGKIDRILVKHGFK